MIRLKDESVVQRGQNSSLRPIRDTIDFKQNRRLEGRQVSFLYKRLTVDQLQNLINKGEDPQLIDVRLPHEFAAAHVKGSINIPLPEILEEPGPAAIERSQRVCCLICKDATKADTAASILRNRGYANIKVLAGGLKSWAALGFPLESFA